jgi:hypothetical protein
LLGARALGARALGAGFVRFVRFVRLDFLRVTVNVERIGSHRKHV